MKHLIPFVLCVAIAVILASVWLIFDRFGFRGRDQRVLEIGMTRFFSMPQLAIKGEPLLLTDVSDVHLIQAGAFHVPDQPKSVIDRDGLLTVSGAAFELFIPTMPPVDFFAVGSYHETIEAITELHSPLEQVKACRSVKDSQRLIRLSGLKFGVASDADRLLYGTTKQSSVVVAATRTDEHKIFWWPSREHRFLIIPVRCQKLTGLQHAAEFLLNSKLGTEKQ